MRRLATVLALLVACLAGSGCGNERPETVSLTVEPSKDTIKHKYPGAGLSVELPRNVTVRESKPPGVFRGEFGVALISGFAYRREERLPRDEGELRTAMRRLVRAAEDRDESFELRESTTTEVDGSRAIELVGDQTISSGRLRIRSLHVYEGTAEYVLELLAPREEFARLDRALFPRLKKGLTVTGDITRPPG